MTVISLSLSVFLPLSFSWFNFLRHALKPLPLPLAKTDTGLAAFMCCVPHVAHITVSEMVPELLPPPPPKLPPKLPPPHHFIHLALWGRLQAPVEVCVDTRCNTSLRGPSTGRRQTALAGLRLSSPRCSSCINICPQLGRTQKGFYSFQSGGELLLWFVFLYGKEWVHSCLKTMMHCSMERLCSCGHSSVQEQL